MKRKGLLAHIEVERRTKPGTCCQQVIERYLRNGLIGKTGLRIALYCEKCQGCLVSMDAGVTFVRESA